MPNLEIKTKTDTEAAKKQRIDSVALGRALADSSEVELSSGGDKLKLSVGIQRRVEELEIEIDGNETELEIELKWRDDTAAEPTADAPAARPTARRGRPRKTST